MKCILCNNDVIESRLSESIFIFGGGFVQKLNDNSIMIVCGWGSVFDGNRL